MREQDEFEGWPDLFDREFHNEENEDKDITE
jgi:hypothetical protein